MKHIKNYIRQYPFFVKRWKKLRTFFFDNAVIRQVLLCNRVTTKALRSAYQRAMESSVDLPLRVDADRLKLHSIEINKNCNLDCLMCRPLLSKRKNVYMDPALFEKILIEKKKRKQYWTTLHTISEPLMNPQLEEYFKLIRQHAMLVLFSTNAQLLNTKIGLLCDYADIIDTFRFSIDGATKETYEKIRRPGTFDALIENLNYFNTVNRKGRYFPNVRMNSIVNTDTRGELAYHMHFYRTYVPMHKIHLSLMNGLCPDNTYFFNSTILKKHIVMQRPCQQLNGCIHILCDGTVTACCRDYNGDLIHGDIKTQTLEEIANSDYIVDLRRCHRENTIPSALLCAHCFMIDQRIADLFHVFMSVLVQKRAAAWDVKLMQKNIDLFFELCMERVPDEDSFVALCDAL